MGFRKSPVLRVESVGEQTFGLVPEDDGDDGVSVLGWLGFLIINLAAWGFIGSSAQMHWMAGFCICALYTCALISFACWLEGQMRYRQFVNLLWVLACTFVFVSGGLLTGAVSDVVYGDSQGNRLWISDGTTIIKVFPELSSARNMYHRKDAVFFFGQQGRVAARDHRPVGHPVVGRGRGERGARLVLGEQHGRRAWLLARTGPVPQRGVR